MTNDQKVKIRDNSIDNLKNLNGVVDWIVVENYIGNMFVNQVEQKNLFDEIETYTPRFINYNDAVKYAKKRQKELGQDYSFSICPLTEFIKFLKS